MNGNHYYGDVATGYDARRSSKPGWAAEQQAVSAFMGVGPVLDAPVGTGRFIESYGSREVYGLDLSADMLAIAAAKHPKLRCAVGSVLDLPYGDQFFGTAVCMRLMAWLPMDEKRRAMAELARVARRVIVNFRIGEGEGVDGTKACSIEEVNSLEPSMAIARMQTTGVSPDGTEHKFIVFEMTRRL